MKHEKHTVNAADLIGYESHFTIAMQAGMGAHKALRVIATLRGEGADATYFVESRGATKYRGNSLADAVTAYNAE